MKHHINFRVNDDEYSLAVDPWRTLNEVLREDLNLTGTKLGCGTGDCGACTVMVDGRTVSSCLTLAVTVNGKSVTTVEGLAPSGESLHPIQEAFIQTGAIQCGFCTAGMEMSALHLLNHNGAPTENEIRSALSGNLCRCTGYNQIVEAISLAAKKKAENGPEKEES
ncbi:MAG: (2Fe-2S)-binding protein [Deltaproteobacteria bacterium]|jgi:carbon-monoxide dehydrogenase small subunit|nr:(2Fe-2S)-binding protein [Deltaproteobacteria bacterium]